MFTGPTKKGFSELVFREVRNLIGKNVGDRSRLLGLGSNPHIPTQNLLGNFNQSLSEHVLNLWFANGTFVRVTRSEDILVFECVNKGLLLCSLLSSSIRIKQGSHFQLMSVKNRRVVDNFTGRFCGYKRNPLIQIR